MTEVEAYAAVLDLEGRPRKMVHVPSFGPWEVDLAPAMAVAGANLINWREDAASAADVMEAWQHFAACLSMNLFTAEEFSAEVGRVVGRWLAHVNDKVMAGEVVV